MTNWNFIGCWRESTYRSDGVVGENNGSTFSSPRRQAGRQVKDLGRIVDNPPPDSVAFKEAAAELGRIAKECHRLALKTGDKNLIAEAKKSFAFVAGLGD